MPFPTNTDFDRFQEEIEWLLEILGNQERYPILSRKVLPNLQRDLEGNLARWVDRGRGFLFPPMILSVHRWRECGAAPELLLDRLEKGLQFNQGNAQEIGNLTGNFWDPQLAASIMMQLMTTASLMERTVRGVLEPVTGNRPDLWVTFDGRKIGLEVTSRSLLRDLRQESGGWVDWQYTRDDFRALWDGPIAGKQGDYDGSFPIVLIVWDCNNQGDLHSFVTEKDPGGVLRSFCDLLAIHRQDCSPFSAIVYLPYVDEPHVTFCDGMTTGMRLSPNEGAGLRRIFDVNPATENGFLPPGELR